MVVLLAGLPIKYILSVVGLLVPVAIGAWHFLLHDYQKQRVLTFLDPQSDPLGSGYHIIQSQIAIGSGGVFGKGYLNGSQAQLEFLPERSTDFIFAVVGRRMGPDRPGDRNSAVHVCYRPGAVSSRDRA